MRLLALDMNTRETGCVTFENGAPVDAITLYTKGVDQAAIAIENALNSVSPDAVAVEAAYMGSNAKSYGLLCELIGMVRSWCMRNGKTMIKLTTVEIDAATDVRGNRKHGNQALARHELTAICRTPFDEHQADAYALAIAAIGRLKVEEWAKGEVA